MTDYEQIIISAERYALGRMTYIVEITVNYILEELKNYELWIDNDTGVEVIAVDNNSISLITESSALEINGKIW